MFFSATFDALCIDFILGLFTLFRHLNVFCFMECWSRRWGVIQQEMVSSRLQREKCVKSDGFEQVDLNILSLIRIVL